MISLQGVGWFGRVQQDGQVHLGWATKKAELHIGPYFDQPSASRARTQRAKSPPHLQPCAPLNLGFRSLGLQTRRGLHSGVAAYYWVRGAVR